MTTLDHIVENRRLPGILTVDRKMQLLNINKETRHLLDELNGIEDTPQERQPKIPDEIFALLKESREPYNESTIIMRGEEQYLIRITPLFRASEKYKGAVIPYVMLVVIEKCVLKPPH